MVNLIGWVVCGVVAGLIAVRRQRLVGPTLPLFCAIGSLGALIGGLLMLIFDTAPIEALSVMSLSGAIGGAVALLAVASWLSRTPV